MIAFSRTLCSHPPIAAAARPPNRRLHVDAGPLEVAVEMAFALLVALVEDPAIAAFGIGQDLPAIVVGVPEIEAVCAVLEDRLADLGELPLLGLRGGDA